MSGDDAKKGFLYGLAVFHSVLHGLVADSRRVPFDCIVLVFSESRRSTKSNGRSRKLARML